MMENIRDLFKEKQELILPFLLSVVLSFSMYDIYENGFFVWGIAIIGVTFAAFALGEFVNKHNFAGSVVLVVITFLCLSAFFRLIAGADYGTTFQLWLLTGSDKVETRFEYLLALLISFVPFFAICIYYFSNVLYRMFFLTLVSIIPCALYVKVLTDISTFYLALIALINVAILLVHLRIEDGKGRTLIGSKAAILSINTFIFALLAVSSAIPKEQEARYYDRFEALFMDSTTRPFKMDYTDFTDMSGNADNYRDFANRRMYTITGNYAPYFKRQCFDSYDFTLDSWLAFGDSNEIVSERDEWYELHSRQSLSMLQNAVKRADELSPGFVEKYDMASLANGIDVQDNVNTVMIYSENFAAKYYLSPSRVIRVRDMVPAPEAGVTKSGVIRFNERPHAEDFAYAVDFMDEYYSKWRFIAEGGSNVDNEQCEQMLSEMVDILSATGEGSDLDLAATAQIFLNVHEEAMEYKARCTKNTERISPEIKELAESITDGLTYDHEKADALARYFIQNGYRYDLEYIAEDTSPEYFLFQSKTGSCSDYASAFVLMARTVGLTVRYCEGFVPDITSRENTFVIKDSCAHAYPEVYLPNIGWTAYEPTVPSPYNGMQDQGSNAGGVQLDIDTSLVSTVISIMGIVMILVILGVVMIPFIDEWRFKSAISKARPDSAVIMAYKRLSSGKAKRLIKKPDTKTAYEFTEKISKITGVDSTKLAFMLENSVYGGSRLTDDDKTYIIECYEMARRGIDNFLSNKAKSDRKKFRARFGRPGKNT